MKRSNKGAISIFLVVVLPIVLIGVLSLFTFFQNKQQKMSMQKVSYAASEAYLSKINSYFVNNFGLLATLDEGNLEQMIRFYYKENDLINNPEALTLTVEYAVLSDIESFKASIFEAAKVSVANEAITYSLDLFGQTQSFERLKQQFDKLTKFEKELSEAADMLEIIQYINQIGALDEVESIKALVLSAYSGLSAKRDVFEKTYEKAKSEIKALRTSMSAQDYKSSGMMDGKQVEWADIEVDFKETSESIKNMLDEIMKLIYDYEALIVDEDASESNQDVIKSAILELLEAQEMHVPSVPMNFMDAMRDKLIQLEEAFTGVSMAYSTLDFGDIGRFTPVKSTIGNTAIMERALINEYFFSVFSSYDSNCPRKINMNRRNESKRRVVGEIEFLITGKAEEAESMMEIKLALFGFRFISNLISYMSDKDKHIQTAQATMAFPPPWKTVAYTTLMTLWCSAESYSDVIALLKGKGLMMIKSGSQWTVSLDRLLNPSLTSAHYFGENGTDDDTDWKRIYYMDYLRILMLVEAEPNVLSRSMDLINLEIHTLSNGDYSLSDFSNGHRIVLSLRSGYTYDFSNWVSR